MDSVLYAFLWFAISLITVTTEICWRLGVTASCVSDYPGIHCREDARGMVADA